MEDPDLREIDMMSLLSFFHLKQFHTNTIFSYKVCNVETFEPLSEYSDTHFPIAVSCSSMTSDLFMTISRSSAFV